MVHCSVLVVDRATGYVHPVALSTVHMVDIYCSMGVGSEEAMLNQGPPKKWAKPSTDFQSALFQFTYLKGPISLMPGQRWVSGGHRYSLITAKRMTTNR